MLQPAGADGASLSIASFWQQLVNTRTTLHLIAGVDDITAVVIILLEGNPKDKSWGAAQKLMNNVDKFLERLRGFKAVIDQGQV